MRASTRREERLGRTRRWRVCCSRRGPAPRAPLWRRKFAASKIVREPRAPKPSSSSFDGARHSSSNLPAEEPPSPLVTPPVFVLLLLLTQPTTSSTFSRPLPTLHSRWMTGMMQFRPCALPPSLPAQVCSPSTPPPRPSHPGHRPPPSYPTHRRPPPFPPPPHLPRFPLLRPCPHRHRRCRRRSASDCAPSTVG